MITSTNSDISFKSDNENRQLQEQIRLLAVSQYFSTASKSITNVKRILTKASCRCIFRRFFNRTFMRIN